MALGFWGTLIVHRGERLLAELFADVAVFRDAELCRDDVSGGWQVTRVFAGLDKLPTDLLATLRSATDAPVLAAGILDSDAAFVIALGRRTPGWRAWLHLDSALCYLVPAPAPFAEDGTYLGDDVVDPDHERAVETLRNKILAETVSGPAAAAAAIGWAEDAGLRPAAVTEVQQAFDARHVFVEETFFALLDRLGIATDEVTAPVRPAVVDVLRGLFGHRLAAVETASHQPVRGQRLAFAAMPDLRLRFDGCPPVTACFCLGEFALSPSATAEAAAEDSDGADPSVVRAVAQVVGRPLTDAATIRHRFLPDLRGVALHFGGHDRDDHDGHDRDDHDRDDYDQGDRDLFVAAHDGRWVVVTGPDPAQRLRDEFGADEIHVNGWLAT